MSYKEPSASGYTQAPSELDPRQYAVVPSDEQQDIAFRSIRAISSDAIAPFGKASNTPERRTPKGIRPMIWLRLNETRSAVVFEVTLHTEQRVHVNVPIDSWRYSTCTSEAVRAAIQKAYLNLLRRNLEPVIVKPGMLSLKLMSKAEASKPSMTASRHNSYDTHLSSSSRNTLGSQQSSRNTHSSSSPWAYASPAYNSPYQVPRQYDPRTGVYTYQVPLRR
jgi:hypothetical protein